MATSRHPTSVSANEYRAADAYHEQRRMADIAREYGESEAKAYARANGLNRKTGRRISTKKNTGK